MIYKKYIKNIEINTISNIKINIKNYRINRHDY